MAEWVRLSWAGDRIDDGRAGGGADFKVAPAQPFWPLRSGLGGLWGPDLGGTLVGQSFQVLGIPPAGHPPIFPKHRHAATPINPVSAPDQDDPRRRNEGQSPPDVAPSEASSAGAAELAFVHESRQSTTATERSEHDDGGHLQWRERVGSAPSDAATLAGATMEIATPRTRSRRPSQTML